MTRMPLLLAAAIGGFANANGTTSEAFRVKPPRIANKSPRNQGQRRKAKRQLFAASGDRRAFR